MLRVTGLYKTFGNRPALQDVSFKVKRGEIHGLLGHNGAGKSTTLGIILGMVEPDRGEASIGGISVQKDHSAALRQVGAIFESPAFYEYLSGWANLRILAGYSGRFDAKAARKVVERVGLADRIGHKVDSSVCARNGAPPCSSIPICSRKWSRCATASPSYAKASWSTKAP